MGYSIHIGNAELESKWSGSEQYAAWRVPVTEHPEAPNMPDTGRRNVRWPSYIQWSEFLRGAGLYGHFHEDPGLMREHPGCHVLTAADLAAFEAAQTRYAAANPSKRPGLCCCAQCEQWMPKESPPPHDPSLDFNFLRLEWLVWWTRWALTNCARPAISNS